MERREVVTSFLQHNGRILVLKRSNAVRTHRGKWAGISGSMERGATLDQALREIREETGLGQADVRLLRRGEPLDVTDSENQVEWRVHPFLFGVRDPSHIELDWEHTDSRWIDPRQIRELDTVPMLAETWGRLWKT